MSFEGGSMAAKIENHTDLLVYRKAFEAAMLIFELSKSFPKGIRTLVGMINHPETWIIRKKAAK
jgi:hypothetical protein